MNIKKIKIKSGLAEIQFTLEKSKNLETFTYSSTALIHKDFAEAMQGLADFFKALTEQECENNRLLITGITFGGYDEHAGVVIVGQRKLAANRVLNLVSPFVKFDDIAPQNQDLITCCTLEAELFTEGKIAASLQHEIEFQESENE